MSPKTRPLTAPTVVNKNGTPAYYSTFGRMFLKERSGKFTIWQETITNLKIWKKILPPDYKRPDDVDRMGPPPRCHTAVVATRSARRRSSITYDINGVRKLTAPPVKKTDRDTNFVQKNVAEVGESFFDFSKIIFQNIRSVCRLFSFSLPIFIPNQSILNKFSLVSGVPPPSPYSRKTTSCSNGNSRKPRCRSRR